MALLSTGVDFIKKKKTVYRFLCGDILKLWMWECEQTPNREWAGLT